MGGGTVVKEGGRGGDYDGEGGGRVVKVEG